MRRTFLVAAGLCALTLLLVLALYTETERPRGDRRETTIGFRAVVALPGLATLFIVLFGVNFIGRSFTPILPLHLQDLGVPTARLASATGILISVYSVAAAASATLLGRASRSRSPRRLLLFTLLAGAPIVASMALVPSYAAFLALAVVGGLVSGGTLTLCYTIGGLMVPQDIRTTAFGFFSGAALFGGALSPTVAGLIAHASLRGIYWVDAAVYLALGVVLLRGRAAEEASPSPPPELE
jgi:MFS family permease